MKALLLPKLLLPALAALALLLLTAATDPPQVIGPQIDERSFTVTSTSLIIRPSKQLSYLHFANGVTVKAEDFELYADDVEIDIDSSGLAGQRIELPKMDVPDERVAQDPGSVAAEMARELKMPEAQFDETVLKRIGAAGNVRVLAQGVSLTTGELVSTDGGWSWTAAGGSQLTRKDSVSGESYSLSAQSLAYNRQSERALAQGSVLASYQKPGEPEILLTAGRAELDLKSESLLVSGGITARYQGMTLSCESLTADLAAQTLHANGGARLVDSESGITLSAFALDLNLEARSVVASGDVQVEHEGYRASLKAEKIEASLDEERLTASGNPEIKYGNSSFSGETIRVLLDGEKTVVEVDGEQQARIDVKELESLSGGPQAQLPGS